MKNKVRSILVVTFLLFGFAAKTAAQDAKPAEGLRSPDVIFVPTPNEVVEAMLKVAKAGSGDIVYDLGSGDGRIPITAVQKFGVERAIGIDINPERIRDAEANAKAAGVEGRVQFLNQDLFETKISDATVVTLYLLESLNIKLLPKLLRDLRPGTRVVSHAFSMGSWKPQQTLNIDGRTVYFWIIPEKNSPDYKAALGASKG
jgi:cyclopropane fatty-acyl-phospholipid synthase-like methyltransferase